MAGMRKFTVLSVLCLVTGACASAPAEQLVFIRTDGQSTAGNPALEQQGLIDRTICAGQTQQSAIGAPIVYYQGIGGAIDAAVIQGQRQGALSDVARGCMAQKGYIQVPISQAPDTLASLQKTAKEREKLRQQQ